MNLKKFLSASFRETKYIQQNSISFYRELESVSKSCFLHYFQYFSIYAAYLSLKRNFFLQWNCGLYKVLMPQYTSNLMNGFFSLLFERMQSFVFNIMKHFECQGLVRSEMVIKTSIFQYTSLLQKILFENMHFFFFFYKLFTLHYWE